MDILALDTSGTVRVVPKSLRLDKFQRERGYLIFFFQWNVSPSSTNRWLTPAAPASEHFVGDNLGAMLVSLFTFRLPTFDSDWPITLIPDARHRHFKQNH
jgi:hypothetical protein